MLKIGRATIAVAITAAISLPSLAQAKDGQKLRVSHKPLYNTAQDSPTVNNRSPAEKDMFMPSALDPDYHGSNGG